MTPQVPRWLFDAARQFDSKTAGVAIGFAGAGYMAGWDDRQETLRLEPVDYPSSDELRTLARSVNRVRPGVPPEQARAVIESLLAMGWRPTQLTDAPADIHAPEPGGDAEIPDALDADALDEGDTT